MELRYLYAQSEDPRDDGSHINHILRDAQVDVSDEAKNEYNYYTTRTNPSRIVIQECNDICELWTLCQRSSEV